MVDQLGEQRLDVVAAEHRDEQARESDGREGGDGVFGGGGAAVVGERPCGGGHERSPSITPAPARRHVPARQMRKFVMGSDGHEMPFEVGEVMRLRVGED